MGMTYDEVFTVMAQSLFLIPLISGWQQQKVANIGTKLPYVYYI
jgi:hypothetical protein